MKVAIVGLISPHVQALGRVLKEKDVEIACVWDYNHSKADLFCRELRCTAVIDDIERIADEGLDGVMICSNAEDHVRHALPFIAGGVPTYIDQPMVTNLADLERIAESVEEHLTPIMTPEVLRCPSDYESNEYETALVDTFLWMCETGEPPVNIEDIRAKIGSTTNP